MSDTEIRMMRYTMEQLSAELQASRQYVSDIKTELERTRKALDIAVDAIDVISLEYHKDTPSIFLIKYAQNAKDQITALKQKDVK